MDPDPAARLGYDAEALAAICRRYRVQRLSFFGSVLRDDFRPESDVDVLVEFEPGARVGLRFFALEAELERLFRGRPVDLVTCGFLGEPIREDVAGNARLAWAA